MSTPSETISTETSQRPLPAAKRGDPLRGARGRRRSRSRARSPEIRSSRSAIARACSLSDATTRPPASGCPPARTSLSAASASRSTSPIQSPSGSSAVRRRRAASAAGRPTREVGAAQAAVGDPLHLAVVGQEGDRAADAVEQRLGVAVGVVGAGDAVLVVGDPGDRRVVGAERRAREQQPEAGAARRPLRAAAPGGLVAHVVRLVGDQQRRPLRAAAAVDRRAGRDRLVGDGDAVAVARLRPVGVGPVRLEVDAVAGRVGGPLAADVGGRRDDARRARRGPREHPVGDVQAEGGLARRRRRRGEEASAGDAPARPRWPPPATRAGGGRRATRGACGPA